MLCFFWCAASNVHLLDRGGEEKDLNYLKDTLFDLINESDELNVVDIESNDAEDRFVLHFPDGSSFIVMVESAHQEGETRG